MRPTHAPVQSVQLHKAVADKTVFPSANSPENNPTQIGGKCVRRKNVHNGVENAFCSLYDRPFRLFFYLQCDHKFRIFF